ncbi:MAG: hypothetical protein LBT64_03170 [Puniceicoccales bacterium]|jgi:hypothetical protein|nr:hypothetical protein [Puniceicoccales bacterium]
MNAMEKIDPKDNIRETKSYEHFSFLLPAAKQWFSPKEMAVIIGKTDQYVRDAFDNQKILGHLFNGRAPKGAEKRKTYMIHRENVLLFLFETANFLPDDFMERLCEILGNRTVSQLLRIQKKIDGIVNSRSVGFFNRRAFGEI